MRSNADTSCGRGPCLVHLGIHVSLCQQEWAPPYVVRKVPRSEAPQSSESKRLVASDESPWQLDLCPGHWFWAPDRLPNHELRLNTSVTHLAKMQGGSTPPCPRVVAMQKRWTPNRATATVAPDDASSARWCPTENNVVFQDTQGLRGKKFRAS